MADAAQPAEPGCALLQVVGDVGFARRRAGQAALDPAQAALYYARVLEIPTPRWSTYDAVRNGLPLLKDVPATIQERAWTSPVWYKPK